MHNKKLFYLEHVLQDLAVGICLPSWLDPAYHRMNQWRYWADTKAVGGHRLTSRGSARIGNAQLRSRHPLATQNMLAAQDIGKIIPRCGARGRESNPRAPSNNNSAGIDRRLIHTAKGPLLIGTPGANKIAFVPPAKRNRKVQAGSAKKLPTELR